jgi:transcriptional regulator with XRE-family HTH domain
MRMAETVRQMRREQGLSQAQLADRARITFQALRNLEDGNTARPRTVERIARALGLTPMGLYERAAAAAYAEN